MGARPGRARRGVAGAVAAAALAVTMLQAQPPRPRFYPDDPIAREPATQDASGVAERDIDLAPDLLLNLFARPGDATPAVRAQNVNTIDEVPDSGWFTNRIYARPLSASEIARGPNTTDGPAPPPWTITRTKTSGMSPGFTMRDSRGETWFVQFDTAGHPRAATAAVAVAVRLFWALGYNQVETHLIQVRPSDLIIAPSAAIETRPGHRRPLRASDLDRVFARAARDADGSFRAAAGRAVPGRVVGPFKYYGTRPDDPNDVVPHEHRRELRALKVFGAWTNLVDMKAGNTLDTVVEDGGRSVVRHYLQDVGSTFGAGALGPRDWDEGYEFLYEGTALWKRLVTLGFYLRPWQTIPYRELPEIGRFEGTRFDPRAWRPRVATAAFLRADDADTFWGALRVAAFSDDLIRAAAREARYSDPSAERLLGDVLIARRDAIARTYLDTSTPLTRFALDSGGRLTFHNAARDAGLTSPAVYEGRWSRYDPMADTSQPVGRSTGGGDGLPAPPALPVDEGAIVTVAVSPGGSGPTAPVDVYFRRSGGAWRLLGVERSAGALRRAGRPAPGERSSETETPSPGSLPARR